MLASLRVKSARGKRSGDGREGRCRLEKAASMPPGRLKGEGMQAKAWRTTSFEKVEGSKRDLSNCSSSTSPETDPGASSVFPFFTEEDRGDDADYGEEGIVGGRTPRDAVRQRSRLEGGESGRLSRKLSERTGLATTAGAAAAAAAAKGGGSSSAKLDYRNPMFHAPNGTAEKAVASLFSGQETEESTRSAMNGSNPMFKRSVSDNGRPRPKVNKPDGDGKAAGEVGDLLGLSTDGKDKEKETAGGSGSGSGSVNVNVSGGQSGKKKKGKAKAMYEHVGRMNVRPFLEDHDADLGLGHRGFRVDTFARNEGETGGKAHFKFVFTLDNVVVPTDGENAKKLRPVLDVIHERSTGKLRVRVNDGREITATESSAVDIALTHVGVVLFNPKTMAKGHHLYTLSLNGRTLFSVLA